MSNAPWPCSPTNLRECKPELDTTDSDRHRDIWFWDMGHVSVERPKWAPTQPERAIFQPKFRVPKKKRKTLESHVLIQISASKLQRRASKLWCDHSSKPCPRAVSFSREIVSADETREIISFQSNRRDGLYVIISPSPSSFLTSRSFPFLWRDGVWEDFNALWILRFAA